MATPGYNFTIDDSSPMIKYVPTGAWSDKVSADPNLAKYYQSSYHYTTTKGAFAALTFEGTGITVIGSRSAYHGAFELRIDGQKIRGFDSFASTSIYRGYLASIRGLAPGQHTVQFINRAGGTGFSSLDLDAFVVENSGTSGGSGNSTVIPMTTVDDAITTNGTSTLTWSSGWDNKSKGSTTNSVFLNGTIHETATKGSSVTLDFVGEGVQIVGAVGPNNTEYNVQLDGGNAVVMNARAGQFIPSSTLYYKSNLGAGPHKLVITNTASDGGALSIDSFQIFGNGNSNSTNNGLPLGAIIGAIVGGVLVLILLLALAFFLWRRKRANDERNETDKFSMAGTSYMERVRNINFRFPSLSSRRKGKTTDALSRSPSRGSQDTAVDPELGGIGHTQKKDFGYGFGLAGGPRKWLEGLKSMVVRNPDPVTPPLPVQNHQRERPVIDIRAGGGTHGASPGMVTVGLESGVPGPNATSGYNRGQQHNPEAAQVWVDGTKRIEEAGRFSDQSLEQAWDGRSNETAGYGSHRRNQSHPAPRPKVPWTGPRDSDDTFRVSAYQRGQGSPVATEYPETPVRARYEVDRHSPISSRYANNGRGQRSDFR